MSTTNRNVRGGKNYKKMKSGNVKRKSKNPDVPVDTTTGIDHYAIVARRLGDNRLLVKLDTGIEVKAVIPGRFRCKNWFNVGDYVQVQLAGIDCYDIIQKINNENEQAKAQTAISKKENTTENIFLPTIEEDLNENSEHSDNNDDEFDAFGNKTNKTAQEDKDVKLNKSSVDLEKYKRKQKEKERDISRRNNNRDYDSKPESVIENSEDSEESENSKESVNSKETDGEDSD